VLAFFLLFLAIDPDAILLVLTILHRRRASEHARTLVIATKVVWAIGILGVNTTVTAFVFHHLTMIIRPILFVEIVLRGMLIHSTMMELLPLLVSPGLLGDFNRCYRTGHATLDLGIEHIVVILPFVALGMILVAVCRHVFVGRVSLPHFAVR
jgi:hypothetical protein